MDSKSPDKSRRWRELIDSSLFLFIGTAIILIGLCGFPVYEIKDEDTEEAAKARSLLYSLQSQLRGPESQVFNQANLDPLAREGVPRRRMENHLFSAAGNPIVEVPTKYLVSDTLPRPRPQTLNQDFMQSGNSQPTGPILSGILIDGGITQAVINDTTVVCGSMIAGHLVVGIYRNSVLLSKNGMIEELRLLDK